jgi:hypothetical protein
VYFQLKSKFKDLKSRTKKKASTNASYMRGTGGGKAKYVELTRTEEEMIAKVIGTESVNGIGGIDTARRKFDLNVWYLLLYSGEIYFKRMIIWKLRF